jgi:hypothetical protein
VGIIGGGATAEGVGFEPTETSQPQQFSRLPQSSALPPFRALAPLFYLVKGGDASAVGLPNVVEHVTQLGLAKYKQWAIEEFELSERLRAHVALDLNVGAVRQTKVRHPPPDLALELVREYLQIALEVDFVIEQVDDEYEFVCAVAPVPSELTFFAPSGPALVIARSAFQRHSRQLCAPGCFQIGGVGQRLFGKSDPRRGPYFAVMGRCEAIHSFDVRWFTDFGVGGQASSGDYAER